jgi:hypothetical protein
MTKIDTAGMYARMAAHLPHDPYGPADFPQEHWVTLPAPTTYAEELDLWDDPQDWCRRMMEDQGGGEKWSRHRDRETGTLLFTFTSLSTATLFRLNF